MCARVTALLARSLSSPFIAAFSSSVSSALDDFPRRFFLVCFFFAFSIFATAAAKSRLSTSMSKPAPPALSLLREAVAARQKVLGETDPDTKNVVRELRYHERAVTTVTKKRGRRRRERTRQEDQEDQEEEESIADRLRKRRHFR